MKHSGYGHRFGYKTGKTSQFAPIPIKNLSVGSAKKDSNTASTRIRVFGLYPALICCLLFLVSITPAVAQGTFAFQPGTTVGGTAQIQTVPVTIQSSGTLGTVKVLTQGSADLDFTLHPGPSCSIVVGQVCNVSVSFLPIYPGLRTGAVLIFDSADHLLGSQSLSGIGIGSLAVMAPGAITTLAGDGCLTDGPCLTGGNTPATQQALRLPQGEATDAAGDLYISDTGNNRIEEVDPAGNVTILAGTLTAGSAGDGGAAASAQLDSPSAMVVDGAGNLIFADTGNNAIRKIDAITHNISTIAGTLGTSGSTGNLLSAPQGLAFDANGNLYIADTGNNRVIKIDPVGNITPLPGSYDQPMSVAFSAHDNSVYIADSGSNHIFKIDSSNTVTIAAGTGAADYSGDGGLATAATLNGPASVAVDPAGNLYIADLENNVIRKVNASSKDISTLAGSKTATSDGDGFSANLASLDKPSSVYLDSVGNLFIADMLDLRIREVTATIANIKFQDMKEGKTSKPIAQTIENDGNASLNLTDLTAAPATKNAGLDTTPTDPITTTCSTTAALAVDANCVLAVEFEPPTVSPVSGLLSVTSDAGNSPLTVNLSGNVLSVEPSSTTITSSSNPAAVGQGVTFTATISSPNLSSPNHVTGTVQFYDGATPIGGPQAVVSATNTATVQTSFTTLGTHPITAVYSGDNSNGGSTTATPLNQVVEQATSLNVVSSANPAVQFSPITFTATLTGWTVAPTGEITFTDGGRTLGSATLNGIGVASFLVPPLAVGTHNITATYAGDATDYGSQYSFPQIVSLAQSSTTLIPSATVIQYSTPVTFTATVTGVPTSTPTGSVAFEDGTTVLATVPVNPSGIATYVNSTLAAGTHRITAVYQGDADYAGSTSTQIITETVSATSSTTMLSASTTNSIASRPITLTARVTASGATPTGTVTFLNGNVPLGTAPLTNGVASIVTASLPVGTNNVTASYGGNSNDSGSTSAAVAITIVQAPTTTVVSSSENPILTLTPVVISATVSNGSAQSPSGQVTFSEDSAPIGVGTLSANGVATLSLPFLTAGSHTFSAVYAGDTLNLSSTSSTFTQTVQLRQTTDVLTSSTTSLNGGEQLTLISVVHPVGTAGSKNPTGTVTFFNGSITLATTPVDSTGVATVTVLLPGASATLTSTYNGDTNYSPSTSSPTTVPVGPAPDFTLQATPTTWQMASKEYLDIQVSLASVRNFTDTFSLGCLGLPADATCTFSKDKVTLPTNGVQTVTLTVDTGHPLLSGTQASNQAHSSSNVVFACLFPGSLAFCFLAFRLRRVRLVGCLLLLFSLAIFTTGLSGCGTIQNSGTPPGTYTFLITATGQTGVSQFVNATMTITK